MKLILLPGLDGTGVLFRPLLETLPDTLEPTVVAYPCDEVLGYDALVARVEAALPKDRPFVLVGESFSGPIAVRIAAKSPPGLAGLVLCASFVRNPLSFVPRAMRHLVYATPLRLVPRFVQAKALLGGYSSTELQTLLGEAWKRVRPEVLAGRIRELLAVDVRGDLRSCPVPILYLRGSRDHVVPERNLRDVEAAARDLQVVRIDAPHLVLQTRPVEATRAIVGFAGRRDHEADSPQVTDTDEGPTLRSELRRGFNAFNLSVGFVTALAIGAGVEILTARGPLPVLFGHGAWPQSLATALVSFLAITAFHAGMHAYFGWRLERGMRAADGGRLDQGERLLRVLDWRGMDHYDPAGRARAALERCRQGR